MKKLLLIAALLFASYGAFADDFDEIVDAFRSGAAKAGWGFQVNYQRRVVFFDIKFSENVKAFTRKELEDFKREFIKSFSRNAGPNAVARIKENHVIMVVHLVMADGYKYKVRIPWHEL